MLSLLFAATLGAAGLQAQEQAQPNQDPALQNLDPKHRKELAWDAEQGAKYALEVEKTLKISKNALSLERVNRVASDIVEIARKTQVKALWGDGRLNPFTYRFKVVEDKEMNAFSLPGGFIYVNEGLLTFVESDDELAGVLAHEIGHAALRHVATLQKEGSKLSSYTLPAILVAIFAGGRSGGDAALGIQLFEQVKASGWSQKAEEAADYAGLQYLVKTSYNATGLLTFMERLARREAPLEASVDFGIFRTHPPSKERAAALVRRLQAANVTIQRSAVTTTFRTTVKVLSDSKVEAWFAGKRIYTFSGENAKGRAEAAAKRLDQFFDATPDMYEVAVRKDGSVVGKSKVLFKIAPEDAEGSNMGLAELQEATQYALKRSVGYLSMVWLAR